MKSELLRYNEKSLSQLGAETDFMFERVLFIRFLNAYDRIGDHLPCFLVVETVEAVTFPGEN